jgi:Flp pilus assembly protein TadG
MRGQDRKFRLPLSDRLRRFPRDVRGVAAVEAAFVFPMLLAVLAIIVVFTQGFEIKRKVAQTARTVTDLVAQYTGVNADQTKGPLELSALSGDLAAAVGTMEPFSYDAPNATTMVLSMLKADASGTVGTVQWSQVYNAAGAGVARTVGTTVAMPSGVAAANGYVLLGEASFAYSPPQIGPAASIYTLQSSVYLPPRQLTCIAVQTIYPACK